MLLRWTDGVFTDRQDARYAAMEGARQRTYAHDLEQASEEVLALAFPTPNEGRELEPQEYPDTRDDDEDIDYDEEISFDDDGDEIEDVEQGWGMA